MATRIFSLSRSVFTSKQALTSFLSRSYTVSSSSLAVSQFSAVRLRPLSAVAYLLHGASPTAFGGLRAFSTRQTQSSLNDSNPNWSNRPPKETILLDGCDFEHWLVVVEKPDENMTRDQIIDMYIKTLAQVVGSEEEARMKIYSVSTRHYFAFGALVSEEMSYKLKELEKVRWVLPDSYLDVKNQDYGGEPFINGEAVPYDPKYHEEWVRNNAKAMERNRRNDRPRNFDRSRNFERRRQNMQNPGGPPMPNSPPQNHGPPGGMPPPNMGGGMPPPNMGGGMPPPNMGGGMPPNMGGGMPPNMGGGMPPPNMGGGGMPPPNMGSGGMPPNNMGGGMPPNNMGGGMPPNNMGGGMPPNNMGGGGPPPNMGGYRGDMRPNMGGPPNPGYPQGGGYPQNPQNFQGGGYPQNNQGPPPPPPNYQNLGPNNNFRGPPPPPPPNYQNYGPPNPGNSFRGPPSPPGGNDYQGQEMPPPPPPRNY